MANPTSRGPSQKPRPKRSWQRLWLLLSSVPRLLTSKRVPFWEKAIFVGVIAIYWIIPFDLIPFMPIDDIIFTLILLPWFSKRALKYENANQK
ncbi:MULTISPECIES: hypothetical protein [Paenibacillus]|uniref:hypothetical protein n=1 Tax=Paenibacillus TaxID=44249 RepID=UPI00148E51ED|nr:MULTISPECIES: hypothetical protein [Paenibacillus]NEZ44109.1 hypothetical protein [Paenibacillus alvei]